MQVFMVSKFPLKFGTLFANTSLGNSKSEYHRQLLITSVFAELNNFIKKRMTTKARDLTSAFRGVKHFNPQIKTGMHLLFFAN